MEAGLPTQADFDLAVATAAGEPEAVEPRRKRTLQPFPRFIPSGVASLDAALSTDFPVAVISVVSHVAATADIATRAGCRVLRTTVMLNDATRRSIPLVVWGEISALCPVGLETGDIVALTSVVPAEFRGARQLKCTFHCRAAVLCRRGALLVEPLPPGVSPAVATSLERLVEWSEAELSYLWRLPPPSRAPALPSVAALSSASEVLDWPAGAELPALRCRVVSVRESAGGGSCDYRVRGHAFRRWQASLVPADSPGVAVLCLLWHFVEADAMSGSAARAAFSHLRVGLEAAAASGAIVDVTACRCTHSAAHDCLVLNNTPRTAVLPLPSAPLPSLLPPPLPPQPQPQQVPAAAAAAFAARRRVDLERMRGRVVAVLWPGARLRVGGAGAELAALSAQGAGALPWACRACAGGAAATLEGDEHCFGDRRGAEWMSGRRAAASPPSSSVLPPPPDVRPVTCLPLSWPTLAPTPGALRRLLRLRCPSCLGDVEARGVLGHSEGAPSPAAAAAVARCSACADPSGAILAVRERARQEEGEGAEAGWGRRAAPLPPEWVLEPALLLLRAGAAATESPPCWWWVRVVDDDLAAHLLGGVTAGLIANALASHVTGGSGAGGGAAAVAGAPPGAPGWTAERAVAALAAALCGTEVEVDALVESEPAPPLRPGVATLAAKLSPPPPAAGHARGGAAAAGLLPA